MTWASVLSLEAGGASSTYLRGRRGGDAAQLTANRAGPAGYTVRRGRGQGFPVHSDIPLSGAFFPRMGDARHGPPLKGLVRFGAFDKEGGLS